MRKQLPKRQQSGFTLVEIAIVLVIIGLLLGGVLKGQELINSAKVKSLANDFRITQTYIYGYQDKFKALPGDDIAAVAHLGAGALPGNGDGVIDGEWRSSTSTDESFRFWQHVRMANLASGPIDTTDTTTFLPTNAEGGRLGITSASKSPNPALLRGSFALCSDGILGKFAKQIDTTLDDGKTDSGSIQVFTNQITGNAATAVPATGAGAIDDTVKYTVCMAF